jgi:two-component system alkaline phosphatase synthesis response regulator PhoP
MMAAMEAEGRRAETRLLIIEDDDAQLLALTDRLTREGFDLELARRGDKGLELALAGNYDLVILDVMLPGKDGFEIASAMRRSGVMTPILMLTARGEATDTVVGLEVGADDYLTKPYEFIELVARVRALLRRAEAPSRSASVRALEFGDVRVDFRSAEATRGGEPVRLAAKELELLRFLAENAGAVLSRDELLDSVWGYDAMPSTRTVDVHIARLRQKLEADPAAPEFILTVRGLGYKLVNCSARPARASDPRAESFF